MQGRDSFPIRLFLVYILFYAGQAIYNTYLNLYLAGQGLSQSQIGLIVSVSTAFILVAQMLWGAASDRARTKNGILLILYLCAAAVGLLYYLGTGFWVLITLVTLFSVFFNPIMPLQDNIMLETLENSRWDYGQVRMGGTIGYCITVLVIGYVLRDRYENIFWMVSLALLLCFIVSLGLPKVKGYRKKGSRTPFRKLFSYKTLMGIVAFNLAFSFGLNLYYSFYPVYFESIGADSSLIGTMMFACAAAEIPALFVVNRVVKRFGTGKVLIFAGIVTSLRWVLLFLLVNPALIIAANLLHGIGYTGFSYCIVTYINATVPKDIRATSQTFNALIGSVFSRVIFGYLGGLASEWFGTNYMMLVSGIVMAVATVVFALWARGQAGLLKNQAEPPAGLT